MLRVVNVFLVLLTAAATCLLYGFKHQVGVQKTRLAELHAAIDQERETIAVLRAEWSHLNDPKRLERLARRHLSLRPASARHGQGETDGDDGHRGRPGQVGVRSVWARSQAASPVERARRWGCSG